MGIFLEFLSDLKFRKPFYDVIASPSYSNGRFEGGACPPSLVLWRVLFEQAPVRNYASHLVNYGRILKLAVCQPNFHDAEIFFGWNGYAIHHWEQCLGGGNAVAHQDVRQLAPAIMHVLVADLVWETAAIPVSNIFPYGRNALPH